MDEMDRLKIWKGPEIVTVVVSQQEVLLGVDIKQRKQIQHHTIKGVPRTLGIALESEDLLHKRCRCELKT